MKKQCQIVSIAALFFLLSFAVPALAQNIDSTNVHIRASLTNLYKKYPHEKVFVHTDADLYAAGQTIWYKAYSVSYGKPTDLSRIIYTVLTDSAGKVIMKNKLPMKNGQAHGNFDLPDSLHSGWYELVAYTAWMMNFGEGRFFHKRIYIISDALSFLK